MLKGTFDKNLQCNKRVNNFGDDALMGWLDEMVEDIVYNYDQVVYYR